MKKIYIAGALNDGAIQYIKNVHNMMREAEKVRAAGFAVYIPCVDILMGIMFGNWEYKDYFENSQPFLDCVDAVYVCPGWENSEGTKRELARAVKRNSYFL